MKWYERDERTKARVMLDEAKGAGGGSQFVRTLSGPMADQWERERLESMRRQPNHFDVHTVGLLNPLSALDNR